MADENKVTTPAAPAEKAVEAADPKAALAPDSKNTPKEPVKELEAKEDAELEASDDSSEPEEAAAPKEEKKKNIKKLKIKVDGKEYEEELDLDDEDKLIRELQLAKVAQKRMSEYSQLEKEVEAFITELKRNPKAVLSDKNIGLDLKQFAAQIIEEEINNSKKSPELLEKERLEAELKAMKDEREREKEFAKQKEFEQLREQEYSRYKTSINEAINNSDLPKSEYTFKKVTDYMLLALQNGMEDITPKDVLPLVQEEMHQDLKQMFSVMPDEVIENMVGKDVFTRVRKKNIQKAKEKGLEAPAAPKAPDVGSEAKDKEIDPSKKVNFKDFFGI